MDYFVNVENLPYYQWQAELLIESFKHHGMEENLVVGLAMTNVPPRLEFVRNLYSHPRTHVYSNMGDIRGYDRMNRLFCLNNLLQRGELKQPFMMFEPDSVLYKPFRIQRQEVPHVIFQANPFFTLETARDHIPNLDKYLSKNGSWVPLGGVLYMDNLPPEIFERAILLTEMLAYEQAREDKEIWRFTERVAWAINIADLLGHSMIEGLYTLEMPLHDYQNAFNFINYERGIQPHFSKKMFMYSPISMGDPFKALTQLSDTISTAPIKYVSSLARKCLDLQPLPR